MSRPDFAKVEGVRAKLRLGEEDKTLAEWRGPGNYQVISGQLDEEGQEIARMVGDLPYFVDGHVNTVAAPYFAFPGDEDEQRCWLGFSSP